MSLQETIVDQEFISLMNEYRKPQSNRMIEECSKNPVLFSEKMLGVRLYAWQVKASMLVAAICNETDITARNKMSKKLGIMTSRQVGKSEWLSIVACWMCVFNKYAGDLSASIHKSTVIGLISATDEQAKRLLLRTRKILKRGDKHMAVTYLDDNGNPQFGTSFFTGLLDETESNNTITITFKNWSEKVHGPFLLKGALSGPTIKSTAPTGKVLGETYSAYFLDEAGRSEYVSDAFHNDDLYPTGNALDAIRVYLSTPWQNSGFFYRIMNPDGLYDDDGSVRLMFTIDAIALENPSYYSRVMEIVNNMRQDGQHDEVSRAYYCRFVKGEASYFSPEKVHAAFVDYDMFDSFPGKCDLGIDFGGQVKSRTVVTISAYNERTKQVSRLYHRVYPVGQDLGLVHDLEELQKKFNIQRIIPEDCPAGDHVNRLMVEKGWNLHLFNPRADKVKKYGAFRAALNRGEIKSYQDNLLKSEMLAMEFSNSSKQSVIQHAPGMTDDAIDSFVMSCFFFVQEEGNRIRFVSLGDLSEES